MPVHYTITGYRVCYSVALASMILFLSLVLTGCAPKDGQSSNSGGRLIDPFATDPPPRYDPADRRTTNQQASTSASAGSGRSTDVETVQVGSGWSILLGTFGAAGHRERADQLVREFGEITGLAEAWVEGSPDRSVVRFGRYASFGTPQAKVDLERIKSIQVGTTHPFKAASFAPFGSFTEAGRYPEYDLLNVRSQYPGYDEISTLQIGTYQWEDEKDREEVRRTAEEAVMVLRAEGEPAFYYHGPRMSVVTVGLVFGPVIDMQTGVSVPEVMALQERFPHNSFNGRVINRQRRLSDGSVEDIGPEPSFSVRVP